MCPRAHVHNCSYIFYSKITNAVYLLLIRSVFELKMWEGISNCYFQSKCGWFVIQVTHSTFEVGPRFCLSGMQPVTLTY